jgi:carbon monoxide dehydrogenase subunit G
MAMNMSGEFVLPADKATVWARLNDPATLQASIPGCESLEKLSDTDFQAVVKVKIGPVSARFNGKVHLTDIKAPDSYRIAGEGEGGVAGFAKGGASVRLADGDGGTKLSYDVDAQVGGKIAQLGARLIDGSARKLAGEFFANFAKALQAS